MEPNASTVAVGPRRCQLLLLGVNLTYSLVFGMLLSVAPVAVERQGGETLAGLVNTGLLLAAVVAQWTSPMYLRRWSHGRVAVLGLLLLGLPALGMVLFDVVLVTFGLNILRGLGFGLLTVVNVPMIVAHYGEFERGRALGHIGIATSIAGMVGPSLGLALFEISDILAGVAASILPLVAVGFIVLCPHDSDLEQKGIPASAIVRMFRVKNLRLYSLSFVAVSIAWAGTVSFLPLILGSTGLASASTFLLSVGLFRLIGRWLGGAMVDRTKDVARYSPITVGTMVVGLAILGMSQTFPAVIASSIVYGTAAGAFMTVVYALMMRESPYGMSAASALWASSIDFGGVLGTAVLTAVLSQGGTSAVLWAMPILVALAIPAMLRRDVLPEARGDS